MLCFKSLVYRTYRRSRTSNPNGLRVTVSIVSNWQIVIAELTHRETANGNVSSNLTARATFIGHCNVIERMREQKTKGREREGERESPGKSKWQRPQWWSHPKDLPWIPSYQEWMSPCVVYVCMYVRERERETPDVSAAKPWTHRSSDSSKGRSYMINLI